MLSPSRNGAQQWAAARQIARRGPGRYWVRLKINSRAPHNMSAIVGAESEGYMRLVLKHLMIPGRNTPWRG
jgi:hypothetical protein